MMTRPTRECLIRETVHQGKKYKAAVALLNVVLRESVLNVDAEKMYRRKLYDIQNDSFHFDPVKDVEEVPTGIFEVEDEWTEEEAREWALNNIG